jgi:REP element-mobilizing transposase RayT
LSSHTKHTERYEVYFCTFTCYKWLLLFEEAKVYSSVFRWFNHLKNDGCALTGYVIMPNHIHVLLYPTHSGTSISQMIGEGKRFLAYDIVNSIKKSGNDSLLLQLQEGVEYKEKLKGKLHQVFRLSFDAKICFNEKMVEQKLDYIHHNPVSGKWALVNDYVSIRTQAHAFIN